MLPRPDRPTGIAILVLVHLLLAGANLGWNLLMVALGFEFDATLHGLALTLRVVLAVMLLVTGALLWSGRPNARLFAQFFYVVGLIVNFKMLLADTRIAWQLGEDGLGLFLTLRYSAEMIVFGACLVYLGTDNARHFFQRVRPRAFELDELTP